MDILVAAVKRGDLASVRALLHNRPELVHQDLAENNEHRALHFAVLQRDVAMTKLLMEAGADARKGIWPHRDATSPFVIARDREYGEIVAVIQEEERLRREELSCPNATISPLQDRIHEAIEDGEDAIAITLLEADPTLIQACDSEGATPLHAAARAGNLAMAEWLLERRAAVNKRNMNGLVALDVAATAEIAQLLLAHGARLTIAGAITLGEGARVRELAKADRSVLHNTSQHGGLLTLAVKQNQLEMVRLLLDLGADVDERMLMHAGTDATPSWGMPLWHAALENHHAIAELLLDRGADPNANVYASGWPLRNAWNHEDGVIKKLLLARGARMQPYMVAEAHDVAAAAELLASDQGEWLANELAWSAADKGCAAIVEMAVERLPWAKNDSRWHWVLIQPIRGATPVRGHFECMQALLRYGVDPNVARYGATALHFAAGYHGQVADEDRARFAAMLIDAGGQLDLRDDLLKSTPLGWACRWDREKMADVLIRRGAAMEEAGAEEWAQPWRWRQKMRAV